MCRLSVVFGRDLIRRPPCIRFFVLSQLCPPPCVRLVLCLTSFITGRSAGIPDFTFSHHNVQRKWQHLHHSPMCESGCLSQNLLTHPLTCAGGKGGVHRPPLKPTTVTKARAQPIGSEGSSLGLRVRPALPTSPTIIIKNVKIKTPLKKYLDAGRKGEGGWSQERILRR